ncbi:hypothetical protein PSN45_003819 [Yamadazyma tenuis]|uniref:WD40 repeat-like protein n=1 Tax=Candida tenuis (strain ATCC 10573 / BCRC 21748 / CBS 615 / JCM 9827 / NBRC 10315 / NRRL Y-1498 / VKM Y-70) TaxID=590646 RepID=G3B354_CANTC|nr:uncharacterized protein CANTEDRAFT_98073 [Yamadazyma tenuis ATCC 10573]EGV64083.1 hypothetical protein CANTEDRAFT_98073 [Yamadazyma tenuis ATCC 10573]WEJ96282.1 hypothetical protein PSN45_003819 [Yamadazyma tenuis]
MAKDSKPVTEATNPVRPLKDMSLKPRFLQNYGPDEDFFQHALEYLSLFQNTLFYLPEKPFQTAADSGITPPFEPTPVSSFPSATVQSINDSVSAQWPLRRQLSLTTDEYTQVPLFGHTDLKSLSRAGSAINVGGAVSSLGWAPGAADGLNYLAVAVFVHHDGLHRAVTSEELSIFYTKDPTAPSKFSTYIQLWQVDPDSQTPKLIRVLDTSEFGVCVNLSWAPIAVPDTIGVLAGTFGDGKLHMISVGLEGPLFGQLVHSSVSYKFTNPRNSQEPVPISCYDFVSHDRVIVGTSDGSIAEYVLPHYSQPGFDGNFDVPSFVYTICDIPVSNVVVGSPAPDQFVVHVGTPGVKNYAFDYHNFRTNHVDSFVSWVSPRYHPGLKLFLCTESLDTLSYSFARNPNERPSLVVKTDGVVSSIASSRHLNHPFVLVGNSFGEVFVVNIARKILTPGKSGNRLSVPLRLWKLHMKESWVLDGSLESVAAEPATRLAISPAEVNVSAVAWNETMTASSMYAAGFHSGLVVIERLDPAFV